MNLTELLNKAQFFLDSQDYIEAKKYFKKIQKKLPTDTNILNTLAFIEITLDNKNIAADLMKRSLMINPNQPQIQSNLGTYYLEKNKLEDSLESFEKAILLQPDNSFYFSNKAKVLGEMLDFNNAINFYRKAIKLNKNNFSAYFNSAVLLNKNARYFEAINVLDELVKINSNLPETYYSLAITYENLCQPDKAIDNYLKVLTYEGNHKADEVSLFKEENYIETHFNLSLLYLNKKFFMKGWQEYEYRDAVIKPPEFIKKIKKPLNISFKDNLLIWGEQGVGDQIIYSSMLKELDYSNITLAIDQRLIPIYKRSFSKINLVDLKSLISNPIEFDAHIPLASLGKYFRPDEKSFRNQPTSFLKPDIKKVNFYKNLLSSKKIKCGISWRSKNEKIGQETSLSLSQLLPILTNNKLEFVDLQYGDNESEKKQLFESHNVDFINTDLDKFNNLDDLIALIDACDLVITSSNVTAHFAGSIGKKTYLMVSNNIGNIWYWHDEKSSCWYPSIKIYRQTKPGDWSSTIKKIDKEIRVNF
jgi:tetratricopeptide (TPR) repeat protein